MAALSDILAKLVGLDSKIEKLASLQGSADALAEIPGLKSQVAALSADLTSSRAEAETLRGQVSAAVTAKEASDKAASEATTAANALKAEVETLKANDKTAAAKAREILAGVGVPPVADSKKPAAGQVLNRAQFNALSVSGKREFIKSGGTLID